MININHGNIIRKDENNGFLNEDEMIDTKNLKKFFVKEMGVL